MELEVQPQGDNSLVAEINKRNYTPYIIALVVVIVLAAIGGFLYKKGKKVEQPIACTEDAKICPDGSAVGRTGPNCEFSPCPPIVKTELQKALEALNIDPSKKKQEIKTTIPKTFTGAEWKAREANCSKGGYNIKPYAGQEVTMSLFETGESYKGSPLDLWAISKDDKLICAYKVIREGVSTTPETFPIISK